HGNIGIWALVSPLIATQFANISQWSFHWLVVLCLAEINALVLASAYRLKHSNGTIPVIENDNKIPEKVAVKWKEVLSLRAVHTMTFFILIYRGVEFTLSVTFIIEERHGSAKSGYLSSNFVGGLMIGRFALLWANIKVLGTRKAIFFDSVLALGFEFMIWFIPTIVSNAVSITLIGFVMGPMFPMIIGYAHRIIPTELLPSAISWIVVFGSVGVAYSLLKVPLPAGLALEHYSHCKFLPRCYRFFLFTDSQHPGGNEGHPHCPLTCVPRASRMQTTFYR
ncbi:hypothetical protein M422DRAFT_170176, partial [Sphaerobolus stellatus SS14]